MTTSMDTRDENDDEDDDDDEFGDAYDGSIGSLSGVGGGGGEEYEWRLDRSLSQEEHTLLQIESRDVFDAGAGIELRAEASRDMFDSMVHHQYSGSPSRDEQDKEREEERRRPENPFAQTQRELLIDDDGFPLMSNSPDSSPSPSMKPKKKIKNALQIDVGQPGATDQEKESASKREGDSLEKYIIPCRGGIKPAREVGKTIGIPYVGVVVGSKPVRTHTTRHADSAQHLQYTKILTAADPPGTAPYSWVQIGSDRRKEIDRVKNQRQTPAYKLQKRNAQIYNRVYGLRATMKHLPPRRFWDDWTSTVRR